MGRPSKYTEEIASEICDRLAEGESLRRICMSDHMPVRSVVNDWTNGKSGVPDTFPARYAQARAKQAEYYFDQVLDLADDCARNDLDVNATKLQVDSRKWVLGRLDSKKYGEKSQILLGGTDGGPVKTETKISLDPETKDQIQSAVEAMYQRKGDA